MTITIDGPTASGKSSVGRMLAKELGYYYIYSGLLYRALAYNLIHKYGYTEHTIDQPDFEYVKASIKQMRYVYSSKGQEHIFLNEKEITYYLKDAMIDQAASIVSTNTFVRDQIDSWQRAIAHDHAVVIDGRDAGTVVFPHADYKFFLTARSQVRAERWRAQQKKCGNDVEFDEALDFITLRDERDSNREHAPLKLASGGIPIDNSDIGLKETLIKLINKIR